MFLLLHCSVMGLVQLLEVSCFRSILIQKCVLLKIALMVI